MGMQGDGVNTTEDAVANILAGIDFGGNWDFLNQGTGGTSASGKAALLNAQLNRNKSRQRGWKECSCCLWRLARSYTQKE